MPPANPLLCCNAAASLSSVATGAALKSAGHKISAKTNVKQAIVIRRILEDWWFGGVC